MTAKLLAAGTLAAALLITGVPLGAGSASAQTTTTVMLAGDSITQGRNGDYTWRYRFAMELRRQGVSNVDLVGPQKAPNTFGTRYPHYLAAGWDTDHDATSGTTLAYQVHLIGAQVARYHPDILVSYLGTNDLLQVQRDHPNLPAAKLVPLYQRAVTTMLANWQTYLDNVRQADPSTKIVLGELVTPKIPESIRNAYNAELRKRAAGQWFALGSPIEVAQLAGSIWSSPTYLYDQIHPSPTAETFLAQQFATAINEVSPDFFPGPILIQRANVPWNPPLTAKAVVSGHRVRLNWAFTVQYNSATKMRVKFSTVRNGKSGKSTVVPFRRTSSWTSKILKPGTYRFKLQAQRATMNSTWSRTIVVKVPKGKTPTTVHRH